MPGLIDFLLGGLTPAAVAAVALAVAWVATRRPALAWSAGVVLGYATGVVALETRGSTLAAAAQTLVRPHEAHQWLPLVALLGTLPGAAATMAPKGRVVHWLLAAMLTASVPLWLLWGGKYLPSRELRDAGFVTDAAWSLGEAVAILCTVAGVLLAAWALWRAAQPTDAPRLRWLLAVIAVSAAAAAAGLTGSFSYAQILGVLAAALGGCGAAAWLLRVPAGPEAAAGPVVMLAGLLILLAATYSSLPPVLAAALWIGIALAAGCLPGTGRLPRLAHGVLRTAACLLPLTCVVVKAGLDFAATQQKAAEDAASNPYLNR